MAWSRLAEPGDKLARLVRHRLGHVRALEHVLRDRPLPVDVLAVPADEGGADDVGRRFASTPAGASTWLAEGLERWRVRREHLDPDRDAARMAAVGGRVIVPGDADWPTAIDDLASAAPSCLWVRGGVDLARLTVRSAALVGSRACTSYGERVASDLAAGAWQRGWTVVSGGAYGIDAAAHRGVLAAGGATVAVVACGVDRAYPRAHERLLQQVCEDGLVVGEAPPGGTPSRWRFLERNRLIAALAGGTVVVEAAWRSGALSTAGHTVDLGRRLGAVPGPVTSPVSAGCHRLLREMGAVCVTDADELVELAGAIGGQLGAVSSIPADVSGSRPDSSARCSPASATVAAVREHDGLRGADLLVYESLSPRTTRSVAQLAHVAGLPERQVRSALGRLVLQRLAADVSGAEGVRVWRRNGSQRR